MGIHDFTLQMPTRAQGQQGEAKPTIPSGSPSTDGRKRHKYLSHCLLPLRVEIWTLEAGSDGEEGERREGMPIWHLNLCANLPPSEGEKLQKSSWW